MSSRVLAGALIMPFFFGPKDPRKLLLIPNSPTKNTAGRETGRSSREAGLIRSSANRSENELSGVEQRRMIRAARLARAR